MKELETQIEELKQKLHRENNVERKHWLAQEIHGLTQTLVRLQNPQNYLNPAKHDVGRYSSRFDYNNQGSTNKTKLLLLEEENRK